MNIMDGGLETTEYEDVDKMSTTHNATQNTTHNTTQNTTHNTTHNAAHNTIAIDSIKVNRRKRTFSETKVAELYQSIGDIGLLNPVTVSKSKGNYTLVAGLHRLEACKKLGWNEIAASVVYEYDREDATTTMGMELIEIDENLIRNDLTVLEQAEHIQRRNIILKELGLLAESGTNLKNLRRTGDNLSPVTKTTEEIASEIGIDERSLQRKQSIATNISEEMRDEIRGLPIADNQSQLLDLARCPEEQQRKVVVFLKDREDASVKDAQKEIKKQAEVEYRNSFNDVEITSDDIQIYHGDIAVIGKDILDNSIDLILTDPPYPGEFLDCWDALAELAARVLKPSHCLIAYSGQINLPEVYKRLSIEGLSYYWTYCLLHSGGTQFIRPRDVMCGWKPIVVFQKPPFKKDGFLDVIQGTGREKDLHKWQQAADELKPFIERYTYPGEIILDPFAGSGTTLLAALNCKRKAIGIEIDEANYYISKNRVANGL